MSKKEKLKVETNIKCGFCNELIYLRAIRQAVHSNKEVTLLELCCYKCQCHFTKHLSNDMIIKEVDEKCDILMNEKNK